MDRDNVACRSYATKWLECNNCPYKKEHDDVYKRYQKLFNDYEITILAPSEVTKNIINQSFKNIEVIIIPHEVSCFKTKKYKVNEKIKIAYTGAATHLKGWDDFQLIVKSMQEEYSFYYLGKTQNAIEEVMCVEVSNEGDGKLSMIEALKKYQIDIVFIGSIVQETYAYIYYEATEYGAYILTTEKSGNVADQVRKNENGRVFKDIEEMKAFLQDNQWVRKELNKARSYISDRRPNNQLFEMIGGGE